MDEMKNGTPSLEPFTLLLWSTLLGRPPFRSVSRDSPNATCRVLLRTNCTTSNRRSLSQLHEGCNGESLMACGDTSRMERDLRKMLTDASVLLGWVNEKEGWNCLSMFLYDCRGEWRNFIECIEPSRRGWMSATLECSMHWDVFLECTWILWKKETQCMNTWSEWSKDAWVGWSLFFNYANMIFLSSQFVSLYKR